MQILQDFKRYKRCQLAQLEMGNPRDEMFVEAIYASEAFLAKRDKEAYEKELKEMCLRCEEEISGAGIPYEDGFYCNSCVGFIEAKAESAADDEADRERELENNI